MSDLTVDDGGVMSALVRVKSREHTAVISEILGLVATHNTPIGGVGDRITLSAILKGNTVGGSYGYVVSSHRIG